ncbi:hypothetical protein PV11_06647 [Exophiala sideris]|uniref:DM2 domain-containing protein n=1 Tax=Exophiala sideris TaxID=1016849 RepID=A0A0D1YE85_9EURO|nr:hypothetical protein PV11_06647 [Exophiala sideris]
MVRRRAVMMPRKPRMRWGEMDLRAVPRNLDPFILLLVDNGVIAPYNACQAQLHGPVYLQTLLGHIPPQHAAQQQAQAQMLSQQMQQRNAAIEHQNAQRRARKPTDLNLPDGIEDIVIGEGAKQYNALREAEKRLDSLMARKRLEYQDNLSRNNKRYKTMRIQISNTVADQHWQDSFEGDSFTFEDLRAPTYKVKVQGRLLEYAEDDLTYSSDEEDEVMEEAKPKAPKKKTLVEPSKPFSSFFKEMNVEFEGATPNFSDPNTTVTWKKGQNNSSTELDSFVFQRKADENTNITICLTRDEQPERFRLSRALADTLDMEEADRAEVVMGLWEYIKLMGLQEDGERRSIRCDDNLRQIFGLETIFFPQVPERIIAHLHPLPPIKLAYTIRVDQEFHKNPEPTVYDVQVQVEDPLRALILKMTSSPENQAIMRQIQKIDEELAVLIQKMYHIKAKHTFFSSMAKDPIGFIDKWLASQKKDLSGILGEMEKGDVAGMEFAKGGPEGVWNSEVVREAVRYRLAKSEAGGR